MRVFGVDEVGRGPLAGPVVAAAVLLFADIPGLADSKTLSPARRFELDRAVRAGGQVALGSASVAEIDRLNILEATLLAMARAVHALAARSGPPDLVLVDGNRAPPLAAPVRTVVGGDASEPAISAASIVAKVARDALMVALDALHPPYGFAAHKGYGTAAHLAALARLGPCAAHRRSFAPVAKFLRI
ncbi:ribonuclease HII [Thermaurantiacus tibetensis]|uniref:ribonuclease HII n=1 Tax=Thermaurantiacus tibetensis TaxID=2759035 RepID=UPI002E2B338D|nr:ribonuclease HII [Thermaurantiacus tibetensis]